MHHCRHFSSSLLETLLIVSPHVNKKFRATRKRWLDEKSNFQKLAFSTTIKIPQEHSNGVYFYYPVNNHFMIYLKCRAAYTLSISSMIILSTKIEILQQHFPNCFHLYTPFLAGLSPPTRQYQHKQLNFF